MSEAHNPHESHLLLIILRGNASLTPINEADIQRCVANQIPDSSIQFLQNDFTTIPPKIVEELGKNGMNTECSIFNLLDVQGAHPLCSSTMQIFIGVALTPSSSSETSFNDWYTDEHIPLLQKVPGWLSSARYILQAASSSSTPRYLAIHAWENTASFDTQEYKLATSTPWREEVMNNVVQRERFDLKKWER
ncbi:hypothetical protein BDQ17DRAFT_1344324 [Cyathus striatus]|nr:hypothetical protein BDQ17DRAFT_1344324 [Cyathus striatus]